MKLLKTIDTVSSTMMVQQPTGGNTTRFVTDTMTIGIQKLSRHGLSAASYSATGAANSTGNFVFPNIANKLASGQDYGVKVRIKMGLLMRLLFWVFSTISNQTRDGFRDQLTVCSHEKIAQSIYELRHEKTNILHMRKQRRRSASRSPRR